MAPILVVEDDADSRELLCELLRTYGYETVQAANGLEALAWLDRTPALSLIVLDLMMPMMDGWEFRRRQQQHPTHGRVPVLVASADTRVNARPADLQAEALLCKPLDFTRLLGLVRRFCGAPALGSGT